MVLAHCRGFCRYCLVVHSSPWGTDTMSRKFRGVKMIMHEEGEGAQSRAIGRHLVRVKKRVFFGKFFHAGFDGSRFA